VVVEAIITALAAVGLVAAFNGVIDEEHSPTLLVIAGLALGCAVVIAVVWFGGN